MAAVRIGAYRPGHRHVLGISLFNLLILGLDDVCYRPGTVPGITVRAFPL